MSGTPEQVCYAAVVIGPVRGHAFKKLVEALLRVGFVSLEREFYVRAEPSPEKAWETIAAFERLYPPANGRARLFVIDGESYRRMRTIPSYYS